MFVQLILAVNPLVTYELKICFFGRFPTVQKVEHRAAKAVLVRMEILFGELAVIFV